MIVHNERGHRIEDEDEMYPEDDAQFYQTPRRNVGRDKDTTPPSSRPRTPINAYYPSNPIMGGGSGHLTSTLSIGGEGGGAAERTSSGSNSKAYAPSVAPSISARSVSGGPPASTGYSDSESRRKGKERDRYGYEDGQRERDRASVYTATPSTAVDRGGPGYGAAPSIFRGASMAGSLYSPSARPPIQIHVRCRSMMVRLAVAVAANMLPLLVVVVLLPVVRVDLVNSDTLEGYLRPVAK